MAMVEVRLALVALTAALAVLCSLQSAVALDNGLARTPPMGWCSWERFRCNTDCANDPNNCISASLMEQMADRMAEDGYADAGYQYVNIDDCYLSMSRDASGQLTGDPARFPDGMGGVAAYIHSKGLKFGVYEDFGTQTCGGYPGSEYHIPTDANTFAAWGADMLKFDGCNSAIADMAAGYPNMSIALNATGRPFVYSCSWPDYVRISGIQPNYTEVAYWCNLWRLFDDIDDSWDSVTSIIDYWGDTQDTLIPVAGPGHWNDMDMIIVGNFGLSYEQSKTQMALWCLLASPLLLSADLRAIRPELREIILNKEVIGINQDALGAQGRREWRRGSTELWWRPLKGGDRAVVLFNRMNCCAQNVSFTFEEIGVTGSAVVRDLFLHEDLGEFAGGFTGTANGSGVVMLRVSPQSAPASEPELRTIAHRLRHWRHLDGVF